MKTQSVLPILAFILAFSCNSKEEDNIEKPLSEQNLEFEIYDSLVVDYLGNLILMDISPDGQNYLLIDQNTDSIFVTDPSGDIKYHYKRTGEGPEMILGNRTGIGEFLDNESYLIPSSRGIFVFSLSGDLKQSYLPEFTGVSRLVIPNNPSHAISNGKVYVKIPGRYSDLVEPGIEFQQKSKHLEILDLATGKYESALPFPKESKFSSETEEYGVFDYFTSFAIDRDSVYLVYRNEPKLFVYHISDLEIPTKVKLLNFPQFHERNTETKPDSEAINVRDFFLGSINQIIPLGNETVLVNYLPGLTDEEAKGVIDEAKGDFDLMFKNAEAINKGGLVLFDGTEISRIISKPIFLGNIDHLVSKDQIWFSPNFEEIENDYSVIYKTRLVSK